MDPVSHWASKFYKLGIMPEPSETEYKSSKWCFRDGGNADHGSYWDAIPDELGSFLNTPKNGRRWVYSSREEACLDLIGALIRYIASIRKDCHNVSA